MVFKSATNFVIEKNVEKKILCEIYGRLFHVNLGNILTEIWKFSYFRDLFIIWILSRVLHYIVGENLFFFTRNIR